MENNTNEQNVNVLPVAVQAVQPSPVAATAASTQTQAQEQPQVLPAAGTPVEPQASEQHADTDTSSADTVMPETWDEFKASNDLYATLPELTQPERLLPADSMRLMPVGDFVAEQMRAINALQTHKDDDTAASSAEDNNAEIAYRMAAIIEMIDGWLMNIAVDQRAYDEWRRGLPPIGVFSAYLGLFNWFADGLGKSARSKTGSVSAR
ncbi:hypothetical protein [Bifidobacterium oedipodis]|uniref:Uncharacterized protein n=1 Tax=Bifidobacterium oedipodis TaxID=2675322 RepID=A0A7Y0ER95_9BIFI|nr:hypothetical protein [Bifidobacterium sp. DSM 109957]NMM93866.1 hypothetical protein [Bifidobacterium sp. DSM 109957]